MKKKSAFLFFILYSLFFIRPLLIPKQILGELTNPILPSPPSGLAGDTYISVLLSGLITAILVAGIVIFIFVFILGAIKWMTAGGDKANVQIAREKVTQALVGLSILLSIFVILNLVGYFFNIESLRSFPSINPGEPTPALTPCFDSDGGIDLYTYGWIRGTGDHCPLNYGVEYDSCNGDYIVEHFCNASNDCASIITECPVGGYDCSSGVCTGPSPTPISAPTPTPDPSTILDPIPLTPIPSDIGTCLCESGIPVEEEDNCIPLYSPYCQDDVACICEGFGIIVTVTPIPQPTNTPALP